MKYKILLCVFIIFIAGFSLSAQTGTGKTDSLEIQRKAPILPHYPDEPPSYPGGVRAWVKHVRKHLKDLKAPCESGKVFIQFKVLKSGKTDSIQVRRGLCTLADKNAIEIVKESGLWQPAYINGKPVDAWTGVQIIYHYK